MRRHRSRARLSCARDSRSSCAAARPCREPGIGTASGSPSTARALLDAMVEEAGRRGGEVDAAIGEVAAVLDLFRNAASAALLCSRDGADFVGPRSRVAGPKALMTALRLAIAFAVFGCQPSSTRESMPRPPPTAEVAASSAAASPTAPDLPSPPPPISGAGTCLFLCYGVVGVLFLFCVGMSEMFLRVSVCGD